MREIKFRAWDKGNSKMVDVVSYEKNYETKEGRYDLAWRDAYEDENFLRYGMKIEEECEVMQWTGLKDNNGNDIYEGDIIYWEIDNGVGIESYTAIVKWSENLVKEGWSKAYKWLVDYIGNYYRGSYDELSTPAAYNDELQVIGNIYENPELMEIN